MAQNKKRHQSKVKKSKPAKKTTGKPKASAKPQKDLRPVIIRAAMDIAGREGWDAATPAAIAAEAP